VIFGVIVSGDPGAVLELVETGVMPALGEPLAVAMFKDESLLWVRDVLETEEGIVLHLLSPSPAPLISPFLVLGDLRTFKYFEL
jgi:hypothetical protein